MTNTAARLLVASAATLAAFTAAAGAAHADAPASEPQPGGGLLHDPQGWKDESFRFMQDDFVDSLYLQLPGEDLDD
ncbi:MAG TPA: hypothetical protein VLH10_25445 [Yinghuangia sp.]|uniref:hypothetical protein n=1 Tax=Yinghuangia sp. YIM S10712 TaxID=3436930 RepID=UPI002B7C1459|nr:hypothetical protein [Yinghuangia sp.]